MPATASGTLPRTGSELPRLALTGIVLIAAGSLLRLRMTRRGH